MEVLSIATLVDERPLVKASSPFQGPGDLDSGHLMLAPCLQSRGQIRQVRYPGDADIVGRVTAVTMRIAASQDEPTK
jgi:hypothetical protein